MIKLNCDCAFSTNNNAAGIGGTFRNSNGDWIMNFHKAIKAFSPTHAELMALLERLKIAKEFNFINMEIETDSTDIIKFMHDDCNNFYNIVSECRWLMYQLKLPILKHNFTEGNEVAHLMAKEAIKLPSSIKCFYHARPPYFVEQEVLRNTHEICNSVKNISTSQRRVMLWTHNDSNNEGSKRIGMCAVVPTLSQKQSPRD
uniref:Uncharacterized protein LOC104247012 n=1 Tax=Nicotiana sylvestris TaxID=4096 RepID=A0A1U7YAU7_NICSY|nr:PREDICTED: uncharacterized protein LOC104247012 [Nicotiana sylvestris]